MGKGKRPRTTGKTHRLSYRAGASADPTGNRAQRRAAARQSPAGIAGIAEADRALHQHCPDCQGQPYANCPCCAAGHGT